MRDRLEAFWDTTPVAALAAYALVILAIPVVVGWLLLAGPDQGEGDNGVVADTAPGANRLTTTTEPAPPPVEELDPFFVVGDQIIDPAGNHFVPVGTNAAIRATDYPYVYDGGNGGVNGRTQNIIDWGWNTVRATLVCFDESGEPSQRQIIDGIDETVKELTEARIVVILTCHDGTGSDLELNGPIEVQVRAFWDQVVPNYKDNPYVWFNFYNEPFTIEDPERWNELHRFYYDRYRSQGVNNIMVFDLPLYAQGIHLAAEGDFVDELGSACNTVLGWHAWGSISGRQATNEDYATFSKAVTDRDLALLISEAGVPEPPSAGTAGNPEWNISGYNAALEVARNSDIGLLWWHGTGDTSNDTYYPLKVDKSGFWTANNSGNLTIAGATFWDFSHQERRADPFLGNLADSGCEAALELETETEAEADPEG